MRNSIKGSNIRVMLTKCLPSRLIPMLVACGKSVLTPSIVNTIFNQLLEAISVETEAGYLSSLYKSFNDTLLVLGSELLSADIAEGVMKATQDQLSNMAQRRKKRAEHMHMQHGAAAEEDREDVMLLEELEEFALEEMARLLQMFDRNHPLLGAIGRIKDLGVSGGGYAYSEDAPTP